MAQQSYFSQGWEYGVQNPKAICPDIAPTFSNPVAPRWAEDEWFDGFLAQREAAYKRSISAEAKADDYSPGEARQKALRKK